MDKGKRRMGILAGAWLYSANKYQIETSVPELSALTGVILSDRSQYEVGRGFAAVSTGDGRSRATDLHVVLSGSMSDLTVRARYEEFIKDRGTPDNTTV